jgi:hypothetical protein
LVSPIQNKKFKRVRENYEIASGLKTKENEIRTATFLTCIGAEALEIVDGLKFGCCFVGSTNIYSFL